MHGEQVERVAREDRQELVEHRGIVEADPRLHGELHFHHIAQRAEDRIHALRLAQQSAPGAFFVNDRRGAAEIQIDRRDGILLQLARGAHERRDVIPDHLRDDRVARGIRHDGFEDPLLQIRVGVNAEVFGEIQIRAAVAGHQPPEWKVRDLLHRREREDRGGAVEQSLK